MIGLKSKFRQSGKKRSNSVNGAKFEFPDAVFGLQLELFDNGLDCRKVVDTFRIRDRFRG